MTNRNRMRRRGATMTAVVALAALLAACNPNPATQGAARSDPNQAAALPPLPATLPLDAGAATAIATAPAVQRLPAAAPIRTVRVAQPQDAWAYADDARDFTEVVYDAPPDYGFDYDGVEPWAWQGYDDSLVFAEPIDQGYRYYYYRPGAGRPYYVRDPDYGYGYDGDRLAVVYGPRGELLPYGSYGPRADYAGRYLSRGEALYRASRDRQRRAVIAANWAARQQAIVQSQRRWAAGQAQQRDWQAYHARTAQRETGYWQQERARRAADTRRYAEWRGQGFNAAPAPARVIPARWQQADWARDRTRYVADTRQADARRQQAVQQQVVQPPQADQRRQVEQLRQRQVADQRLRLRQQQQQQQAAAQRAAQMQRAAAVQRQRPAAEGPRPPAMQQQPLRQQQAREQAQRAQAQRQQQVAQQRAVQARLQDQRAARPAPPARNPQADRARQPAAQRQMQVRQAQARPAQLRPARGPDVQRPVQQAQRQAQAVQRQAQMAQRRAAPPVQRQPQPARAQAIPPSRPAAGPPNRPGPANRPDRKDHR